MLYLISIEILISSISVHIICWRDDRPFTLSVRSIYNSKKKAKLINAIMQRDYQTMVNFFYEEYNLTHSTITFSYGPNLKERLRQKRRQKQNELEKS